VARATAATNASTLAAPAPRPAPADTRRMMLARVSYLFDARRAAWALNPSRTRTTIEEVSLTATPEAVTDVACERLARAVRVVAPRHAAALLRDERLVWRFPLGATFLRSPLTEEQRDEEHMAGALYHDAPERDRVLWCINQLHASGFVPRDFPVDPRAAYEREPYSPDARAMRARDEADGVRMIEDWAGAWPPGVEVLRVCEMLRATGAPDAAAVADDIRGTVFGGPDVFARLGARPGPAETAEQRIARRRAIITRWADAFDGDGYVAPLIGGDVEAPAQFVTRTEGPWGEELFARAPAVARALDAAPAWLVDHVAEGILRRHRERWSPVAVAHIAAAVDRIDAAQRNARMFALPAAQEPRVVFEMMARADTFAEEKPVAKVSRDTPESIAARRVTWRVAWDGRPQDRGQKSFAFAVEAPTADVFRDILKELGAEGLRDYVILHRMAAEQGRTGRFRWTWEAHKRATAHEARVRTGKRRDDDTKRATLGRIARLRRAELHVEAEDARGRRHWRVVGEAPLVSITGGVDAPDGDVEGLELVLNPTLYQTAAAASGERGERFFTQLPEAVLSLPALAFSLAVMLAFRWRYAVDEGGAVTIPKAKLHEYMDAGRWRSGNAAAAEETLSRALGRIAGAFGAGCGFADEGDAVRAHPGAAFIAAVVDRVPPSLPASTANVPRTGAELRAWREKRKLSQVDAAAALGVGKRTIVRAELAPAEALPRAFKRATWGAASALPGPVEGEGSQGGG